MATFNYAVRLMELPQGMFGISLATYLLPTLSGLAADRLRPVFLFDAVPTRVIEAVELADIDPEFASLRNLNSPEEYDAALRELQPPA